MVCHLVGVKHLFELMLEYYYITNTTAVIKMYTTNLITRTQNTDAARMIRYI